MKNLRTFGLYFACALVSFVLLTACKKGDDGKAGATGPTGAAGAAGSAGAAGAAGATGIAGNTMLNGDGAPADTLGVTGDFYLDVTNKTLYGPKTATGWGTGVSIKGADGAPGKDADVVVDTFTITNDTWDRPDNFVFSIQFSANSYYNWPAMFTDRYNPAITANLIETGVVIVDVLVSPTPDPYSRTPLPFKAYAGTFDMNLDYRLGESGVEIVYYLTNNATGTFPTHADIANATLPDYRVKVITIPATVVTQLTRVMTEQKAKVKTN